MEDRLKNHIDMLIFYDEFYSFDNLCGSVTNCFDRRAEFDILLALLSVNASEWRTVCVKIAAKN